MAVNRPLLAVLLAGLATACSGAGGEPAPEGDTVACAVAGAADFAEDCVVERVHEAGSDILVLHHPDGGFRRLIVLPSGGLIAADGAATAEVIEQQGMFEVTLEQDRYRLPQALVAPDVK